MREQAADELPPTNVQLVERLRELPPEIAARGRPFDELDRDYAYLNKNYDRFERDFPGEWVAILEAEVLGHSPKFNQLWRDLRKRGLTQRSPITVFIEHPELA
jgi:hypothetical protein